MDIIYVSLILIFIGGSIVLIIKDYKNGKGEKKDGEVRKKANRGNRL